MVKIEERVNLAKYTTLGVGGSAEYFARASNRDDLLELLAWAHENKKPVTIIGGGSNLLISDTGVAGLVILNRSRKVFLMEQTLNVDSGANFITVAKEMLESNLSGLEWGSGIPGTIGGAIVGNAGALGGQISDVLVSAKVWHDGSLEIWHSSDFDFEYRNSKLKGLEGYYLISAEFHLQPLKREGLKTERGFHAKNDVFEKVHADKLRRSQSYKGKTAGSYFKNPEGFAAAELIDRAGLKGYQIGGAEVSTEHANVFRNVDNATARDIYALEEHVTNVVKDKFGVTLIPEVIKLGKF